MIDQSQQNASGADQRALAVALAAAEPGRLAALSATLALMVGVGLTLASAPPFIGGALGQAVLGLVAAAMIWRLGAALWRPKAIAVLAPLVGKGWGQTQLDIGLAAIDWSEWWEDWGLRGFRLVGWRSSGTYRDVHYSVEEVTVKRRPHKNGPTRTTHQLIIGLSVPTAFSGTVDILPASGVLADVDAAFRKLTQHDMQRISIDPRYDSSFDTLATADAAVKKLLTPGFCTAMLALAEQHQGLVGRFAAGRFRLQLVIPDLAFRTARLHRPLPHLAQQADRLWWELTVPHRLIDALMGDHDGPLR